MFWFFFLLLLMVKSATAGGTKKDFTGREKKLIQLSSKYQHLLQSC